MRITANAKLGSETKRNAVTVDILSSRESARDADQSAHGTATNTAINCAMTTSISVRGNRSTMRSLTGGSPSVLNCTPKSPVTKSPSHSTYRTGSGSSRLYCSLACSMIARLSGLSTSSAAGPRMLNNGSPSRFIAPNVSMLIVRRMISAIPSRWSQNLIARTRCYSASQIVGPHVLPLVAHRRGVPSGEVRSQTPRTFAENALSHGVW